MNGNLSYANDDSFTSVSLLQLQTNTIQISRTSTLNTSQIGKRFNPEMKKAKLLAALHEIDDGT